MGSNRSLVPTLPSNFLSIFPTSRVALQLQRFLDKINPKHTSYCTTPISVSSMSPNSRTQATFPNKLTWWNTHICQRLELLLCLPLRSALTVLIATNNLVVASDHNLEHRRLHTCQTYPSKLISSKPITNSLPTTSHLINLVVQTNQRPLLTLTSHVIAPTSPQLSQPLYPLISLTIFLHCTRIAHPHRRHRSIYQCCWCRPHKPSPSHPPIFPNHSTCSLHWQSFSTSRTPLTLTNDTDPSIGANDANPAIHRYHISQAVSTTLALFFTEILFHLHTCASSLCPSRQIYMCFWLHPCISSPPRSSCLFNDHSLSPFQQLHACTCTVYWYCQFIHIFVCFRRKPR